MNHTITVAMLALMAIGITFIYSAGTNSLSSIAEGLWQKQLFFVSFGIIVYFVFANINYRFLVKYSWIFYLLGILLLLLVFAPEIGLKKYGSRRWIDIGFIQIQPSEIVKMTTVLVLSWFLGAVGIGEKDSGAGYKLIFSLLLVVLPMFIILKQPDLGSALVFLPLLIVMLWIGGIRIKMLGFLIFCLLVIAIIFLTLIILPAKIGMDENKHNTLLKKIGISEYQKKRVLVFVDSSHDPLGSGWNKMQSQIAIGSGRMWGKGYLQGTQNLLGYLPKTVAPNDFIFSVIAEETGFFVSMITLILFAILVSSCIKTALVAININGALLAAGFATLIFAHSFVNIGMTIGILPITGIPLPLVSYGGTFLLVTTASLGVVQNIHIEWKKANYNTETSNYFAAERSY